MPWREISPMEERLQFVTEYGSGLFTMRELAEQYAITPKTGYKWVGRYERDGPTGLLDQSRRPRHSPHASDPELVDAVLAVRRRHPRWGAAKLLTVAARQGPHDAWPSRSTICRRLKDHGLVPAPRRRHRPPRAPTSLTVAT